MRPMMAMAGVALYYVAGRCILSEDTALPDPILPALFGIMLAGIGTWLMVLACQGGRR